MQAASKEASRSLDVFRFFGWAMRHASPVVAELDYVVLPEPAVSLVRQVWSAQSMRAVDASSRRMRGAARSGPRAPRPDEAAATRRASWVHTFDRKGHDVLMMNPQQGNPSSGLICGYLMDSAGKGRAIECDEAAVWLSARAAASAAATPASDSEPDRTFAWLHFNLTNTGALPWVRAHAGLGDDFYAMLEDSSHATRIERSEQALVAVINDVHFDFSFEPSDIATLWISVERHLVVTARRQPLRSIDRLRESVKSGHAIGSSIALLEYLLHLQAEVLADVIRGVTAKIDTIEELSNRPVSERLRLGALRRLLVRFQRLLAPEPASLFRLLQHPPAWIATVDTEELRRTSEEFSLVLRDMGLLQDGSSCCRRRSRPSSTKGTTAASSS